jgi:hypothetical protein
VRRPLALASVVLALGAGLALTTGPSAQESAQPAQTLRPLSEFDSIADPRARSVALFEEAGKVIMHPRCVNCHPATERPLQGMAMVPHQPPVVRGEADFGMPGMTCNTCHGPENVELIAQADGLESIPGHPEWHVAPIEQAWENRTLGEICLQIKDVQRNGGKDMAELVAHMAEDTLVGWGWNPGKGREPVPGTQQQFGEIFKAWADSGAECPPA